MCFAATSSTSIEVRSPSASNKVRRLAAKLSYSASAWIIAALWRVVPAPASTSRSLNARKPSSLSGISLCQLFTLETAQLHIAHIMIRAHPYQLRRSLAGGGKMEFILDSLKKPAGFLICHLIISRTRRYIRASEARISRIRSSNSAK